MRNADVSQWKHAEAFTSGYGLVCYLKKWCVLNPHVCSLMHPKLFVKVRGLVYLG